ncbi:MAG: VOC family protein [Acidimicrobiia bacterium]|nr:VOC family protein [Acidimicrobiia bacterium]
MKIDTHQNHAISWVDLAAKDLDAQIAFYTTMMGWNTFQAPGTDYTMFMVDDQPVAGVMAMTEQMGEMPSVWSTYVAVEDAAATCARATELGGTVFQEPFDIPDGGKIAVVADPAGAVICFYEGSNDTGFRLLDEPGAPCWFETMSRNAEAATEFYTQLFGWETEAMPGGMPYTIFKLGETPVGGCMQMGDEVPAEVPSHWQVSFSIATSIEDFIAKATEHGAQVMMGPMSTPYGEGAVIVDPGGAAFTAFDRSTAST